MARARRGDGRALPDGPQPLQPGRAEQRGRRDGERHGAGHHGAPHRSVGGKPAGLHGCPDRGAPGMVAARRRRLGLAALGRDRRRRGRRARRVAGLVGRLPPRAGLRGHARRAPDVPGRRLPAGGRQDDLPADARLRGPGRWHRRCARRSPERRPRRGRRARHRRVRVDREALAGPSRRREAGARRRCTARARGWPRPGLRGRVPRPRATRRWRPRRPFARPGLGRDGAGRRDSLHFDPLRPLRDRGGRESRRGGARGHRRPPGHPRCVHGHGRPGGRGRCAQHGAAGGGDHLHGHPGGAAGDRGGRNRRDLRWKGATAASAAPCSGPS